MDAVSLLSNPVRLPARLRQVSLTRREHTEDTLVVEKQDTVVLWTILDVTGHISMKACSRRNLIYLPGETKLAESKLNQTRKQGNEYMHDEPKEYLATLGLASSYSPHLEPLLLPPEVNPGVFQHLRLFQESIFEGFVFHRLLVEPLELLHGQAHGQG